MNRQILVMLRTAPPHFRPDISYSGSYNARSGSDGRRRTAEALAARFDLDIVENWPMPALGVDCFVMTVADRDAVPRIVLQVAEDPRVESVQAMQAFHVLAHNDSLYALQPSARTWHLADMHKIATGSAVSVAEIDTGVERNHPDLAGRVAIARNFVDGRDDVAEIHGTAVAGIIAARADNGIGVAGIAPDAQLMTLRACWETVARAICNTFTVAKAMQFALDEKAKVINMSLGGPRDRLLERLLDAAAARGVTIVAAVDPSLPDGGFPASHRGVLAVAADDVHDTPANALLAPGRDIPTTVTEGRWGFVTGSSFAAAHVTGLVALMRELAPRLSAHEIREALAVPDTTSVSAGRHAPIDACAAIARIGGVCACACTVSVDSRSTPLP
jgi:subtilisin family serine protease